MLSTLNDYKQLLRRIDDWFGSACKNFPVQIKCASGCSGCCRGLFDITILDGALLQQGFKQLPEDILETVLQKAGQKLEKLQLLWPGLAPPYILNLRPEEEWEELMPDEDETPCPLLDNEGRCLVYEYRPMTCRLHGLPLVDLSGEVMHNEWCTENFIGKDPLCESNLRASFDDIFRSEVALGRTFTKDLLGETVFEMDTFIPLALLTDFTRFQWNDWWECNRVKLLPNP